jgi:peptide/nickel transport system permease protein
MGMFTYILRKLLYMPLILLGVIFITFLLFQASTSPEALARIQLGEKASARVVYEWAVSKGHAAWTDAGRMKLRRLADGELISQDTEFFVDGRLREMIRERDRTASRIEKLVRDIQQRAEREAGAEESDGLQRLRGELAVYTRRQAANRGRIKEALMGARRVLVSQELAQELRIWGEEDVAAEDTADMPALQLQVLRERAPHAALDALLALDGHNLDMSWAEADIALREAHGLSAAEQREALAEARKGFLAMPLKLLPRWNSYAPVAAHVAAVEDIAPDLSYTFWVVQFGRYLWDLLRLDFGNNNQKRPVTEVIWQGLGPSLSLTLPAFLIAELIGVFFGLMAAMYRQSRIDHTIVISAILLMSINSIAMIMFGQKWLAYELNYFPVSGYEGGLGAARFLILPVFLYVILSFGERVRFSRIVMLDETNQDYVRTARAKGLGENTVLFKHILRNTLIPLITRWVVAIPTLYLGSLVLESFFGIPGLGRLTIDAVNNSDANVIRAIVVIGSVGFMLANLLTDVLYAAVDPRVRLE